MSGSKKGKRRKVDFAPRVPLSVRGGIRVQSSRIGFARNWWSRQWLLLLERYQLGARLGRGRSYAYAGQIATIELEAGRIVARVQGADRAAYACEIRCAVLTHEQRDQVVHALQKRPLLLAALLVRQLPKAVASIFAATGLTLLPDQQTDLATHCTCPDRVNPCKHLAAVFFLMIEAFDQDPLLLLALRGVTREALLGLPTGAEDSGQPSARPGVTVPHDTAAVSTAEAFWGLDDDRAPDFGPAPTGNTAAPLVQRLGPLPMWRAEDRFMDVMTQVGGRAVALGWRAWAGEYSPRAQARSAAAQPALHLRKTRLQIET